MNDRAWFRKYITADQERQLSEVVAQAEKNTEGEIVAMIVKRSSAVGHVAWLLMSFFMIVGLISQAVTIGFHWSAVAMWLPLMVAVISVLISLPLSQVTWIQRLLTPNADEVAQVHLRAELEFHRLKMQSTLNRTGILIFVSLMERRAVVLADVGISNHYNQTTWDELIELITKPSQKGQLFAGLSTAILRAGEILSRHLPIGAADRNEVANHLIIKD